MSSDLTTHARVLNTMYREGGGYTSGGNGRTTRTQWWLSPVYQLIPSDSSDWVCHVNVGYPTSQYTGTREAGLSFSFIQHSPDCLFQRYPYMS